MQSIQDENASLAERWPLPRRDRVREHTAPIVNQRIERETRASITTTLRGGRDAIERRLVELDQEWDIDRALMLNFAVAGAVSSSLGFARYQTSPALGERRKGFLYLFGIQLGFLLVHATVGWCPPLVVFRRLGYRTKTEIESERTLLEQALDREDLSAA